MAARHLRAQVAPRSPLPVPFAIALTCFLPTTALPIGRGLKKDSRES